MLKYMRAHERAGYCSVSKIALLATATTLAIVIAGDAAAKPQPKKRDDAAAWARAGEALERVLLEITRHGYAASPLTQAIEVAHTRELLRSELSLPGHPQLLLRVGRAPAVSSTRRRPLTDVLTVVG